MSSATPVLDSEAEPSTSARGTYAFVTLGCPKNLVDSEKMLGHLAVDGYALVSEPDGADFVVVNTCGFIDESRRESIAVIEEMLELKRAGRTKGVIVAGCLPERMGGTETRMPEPDPNALPVVGQGEACGSGRGLLDLLPEIDHVVGVFGRDEIAEVADRLTGRSPASRTAGGAASSSDGVSTDASPNADQKPGFSNAEQPGLLDIREVFRPAPITALDDRARLRITPAHFAYLKVSEGCDRTCTFCSIPSMRGKHVTKPIEMVVDEAAELAADGCRELIIVAQDTTYYGLDLYGEVRLVELLDELEQVDGLDWIRLMYLYPIHFSDRLIEKIASSERIIPYLDMPLQHVNDTMLKRMQRRVNRAGTEELVGKLRERVANLVLRTTFITGFPGETDEQFEELVDFVRDSRFERMGVFPYSYEPGTPATKLPDHLPDEVKLARRDHLMEVQQEIAFEHGDSLVGYELDVLVDGEADAENGVWVGRTYADAPEIDGNVYFTVEGPADAITVGDMVPVEITARDDYDLVGVFEPDDE